MHELREGVELPPRTFRVTRADLVRYAGASGDFNPIHWSDRIASAVGLSGVIAHGMLTMAFAGETVAAWVGRQGTIIEFGVRFANPVVVPDDDSGTEVTVSGVVRRPTEDGLVPIDVSAVSAGQKALGQARALVRMT
jgi:acyl dehydratase